MKFVFKKLMSVLGLNADFTDSPNVDEWGFRRIRVIRAIRVQKIHELFSVEHGFHG